MVLIYYISPLPILSLHLPQFPGTVQCWLLVSSLIALMHTTSEYVHQFTTNPSLHLRCSSAIVAMRHFAILNIWLCLADNKLSAAHWTEMRPSRSSGRCHPSQSCLTFMHMNSHVHSDQIMICRLCPRPFRCRLTAFMIWAYATCVPQLPDQSAWHMLAPSWLVNRILPL